MNAKPLLVIIAGPTAAGKTAFAIRLAQALQTEIISFDSRQFYRELNIGTAKPSSSELEAARHHFINSHSVKEDFNVALFENAALIKIKELSALYPVVIAVGGSGLYLKALIEGLDQFPDIDQEIKLKLENLFKKEGLPPLKDLLLKYDPAYYNTVDLNNPRRVIRALEVCLSAGLPYSSFIGQPVSNRNFTTLKFFLSPERPELYTRINARVDQMIEAGFIDEARSLTDLGNLKVLRTVGYTELFAYLDGRASLTDTIELIKQNTRRYAKRQITWFKNQGDFERINQGDFESVLSQIREMLSHNQTRL